MLPMVGKQRKMIPAQSIHMQNFHRLTKSHQTIHFTQVHVGMEHNVNVFTDNCSFSLNINSHHTRVTRLS